VAEETNWYRIKDLERKTGVPRRNVHFYLQQGLLHPPRRTGRTMAYYDDGHVAELTHIRAARESGTPLFAIKAQLAARSGAGAAAGTPARRGRPRVREDMREKVLELGCRMFLSKGYRATAVSDITSRLEVGKGTFYYYFPDKDELFLECAPRIFQALFATSWNKIRQERDPLRRLERRAEAVLPVLDQFCAVLALCREALQSRDAKIRAMGKQTITSICRPLEDDLSKGIASGLIRPLDARATSVMLVGVMESLQYFDAIGTRQSAVQFRDAVSTLVTAGIRSADDADE